MKKRFTIFLVFVLLAGINMLSGCSSSAVDDETEDKLIVAVSIVPEQTFVEAVAGDLAEVITMIPAGSNPENYEPTAGELEEFYKSDVYFAIGVPTEETNILPHTDGMNVVMLNDMVAQVYEPLLLGDEEDPHIWLSIKRVKLMIGYIADELSALDPDNETVYQANAEAYIAQLDDADTQIHALLDDLAGSKFVVYHPAFAYFADEYGLEMFALEEEGKEATAQHLQDMIDLAKEEDIKVIFYQSEVDSSQSEAYAEEVGGVAMELAPLSADYINNLINMATAIAEAAHAE